MQTTTFKFNRSLFLPIKQHKRILHYPLLKLSWIFIKHPQENRFVVVLTQIDLSSPIMFTRCWTSQGFNLIYNPVNNSTSYDGLRKFNKPFSVFISVNCLRLKGFYNSHFPFVVELLLKLFITSYHPPAAVLQAFKINCIRLKCFVPWKYPTG